MDKKWILLFFLLSAACDLCAYIPHRYHFIQVTKTWTEAQAYCRQTYTDLATINTMEEMKKLTGIIKDPSAKVWIGLKKVTWRWSLQDGTVYREGQTYSDWIPGEPSSSGHEYCVTITKISNDQGWNNDGCGQLHPFVCFEGFTDKYILISEPKSWYDAQSYCRENHKDLASVRNQTENDEIQEAASGKTVWIGLYNDFWKWSDQSNSSFRYWLTYRPNNFGAIESCTTMTKIDGGRWNNENCETTRPFICSESKLNGNCAVLPA